MDYETATTTLTWLGPSISPLVVGIVLWVIGTRAEKNRIKTDAIRDLMTYRGDFASSDFRRSLNKISVVFHSEGDIRNEVRHLYEVINNGSSNSESTKRSIVGLIYKLCQKNGFKGLTEYDIDQAFPENRQAPDDTSPNQIVNPPGSGTLPGSH